MHVAISYAHNEPAMAGDAIIIDQAWYWHRQDYSILATTCMYVQTMLSYTGYNPNQSTNR